MDDAPELCQFHSDKLKLRIEMTMPCDVTAIDPVVEKIMGSVRDLDCSPGNEYEVELAIREALANAIIHGGKGDSTKTIQFCVACEEDRGLLIVVRDPGEGFDPESIPSPIVGQNLFSRAGRGIFLINQFMDEVRFEKGGTEIQMLKRRQ